MGFNDLSALGKFWNSTEWDIDSYIKTSSAEVFVYEKGFNEYQQSFFQYFKNYQRAMC